MSQFLYMIYIYLESDPNRFLIKSRYLRDLRFNKFESIGNC